MRIDESAARSVFRSLLLAEFFEEAGEVQLTKRISSDPALESSVRESERRRRRLAEMAGEKAGRKQASPMLVAVLVATKLEVLDVC